MKMTIDINLTGKQICDYLEKHIGDMSEFDEFYKRERLIRLACENSTYPEDIDAMKKLFLEIIKHEEKRQDEEMIVLDSYIISDKQMDKLNHVLHEIIRQSYKNGLGYIIDDLENLIEEIKK